MRDDTTTKVALGAFDPARVKSDYELVSSLIGHSLDVLRTGLRAFLAPELARALKTAPLKRVIEANGYDAVIAGIAALACAFDVMPIGSKSFSRS